ncbi:MAG: GNAT family N-acetyltransferase [Actinobacteria bacterium]|nr:GNAT family N-acetyltransferase [Actinomycetota bacterium]
MVDVSRISESQLPEFLAFMDGPAFKSQPQWQGCYCQFYLNSKSENEASENLAERNRQSACDRIRSGVMQGYVAKENGQVVGWMAANSFKNFVALPGNESDIAAVICFVIEKDHQGRGIAKKLLQFALNDLPNHGYVAVRAAPLADGSFQDWAYRGPRKMFEDAGFTAGPMLDDKHILMSRALNS